MPYLYVLLSKSDTWFSEVIFHFSPGDFTHASLALERELPTLYSFGRKNPRYPLPGGFIRENVHKGIFDRCGQSRCQLYRVPVTEEGYRKAERLIDFMEYNASAYRYNLVGTFLCKLHISRRRNAHYFCSEFVAEILNRSGAARIDRPASLIQPWDLTQLPELELIYEGPLSACDNVRLTPLPNAV